MLTVASSAPRSASRAALVHRLPLGRLGCPFAHKPLEAQGWHAADDRVHVCLGLPGAFALPAQLLLSVFLTRLVASLLQDAQVLERRAGLALAPGHQEGV